MKKNLLLIFTFLVGLNSASANSGIAAGDSVGMSLLNGKKYVQYSVAPGETLYRISTAYKVSVAELNDVNPELEQGLKVGQVIHLPYNPQLRYGRAEVTNAAKTESNSAAATKKDTREQVIHIVQPGETVFGLAKKYEVSIEDIKVDNGWNLQAGQEVIVFLPAGKQKPEAEKIAAAPAKVAKKETVAEGMDNYQPEAAVITLEQPVVKAKDHEKKQVVVKSDAARTRQDSIALADSKTVTSVYPNDGTKRILVIPFDPYLYFSDADDEIAAKSKIQRNKVRQVFRRRLNVLIDPPGYETIHLMGGTAKDSLLDLNRIYSSVKYGYQDILYKDAEKQKTFPNGIEVGAPAPVEKTWAQKQKDKLLVSTGNNPQLATKTGNSKDNGKYFGVKINDKEFYNYFNNKYHITYYVFINQFEVKTNYENCLDRAAQDYERNFVAHFSIFDKNGKQVAGNKVKIYYNSNSNSIFQIVNDNMQKMADAILSELPPR